MSIIQEEQHSDSEDEPSVNIVGDIPLEWYDEFDHIGYQSDGSKLIPKERPDLLDEVIRKARDPFWYRRYYDKREGQYKTITAEDLDLVSRLRSGDVAIAGYNYYQPFKETEFKDKIHPLTNKMLSKKHFQPSKSTLYKISQVMASMRRRRAQEEEEEEKNEEPVDIWSEDFICKPQKRRGLPAPKPEKPTTDDSYHPPDDDDPKRLLEVDGYKDSTRELYERCCDLYLAPREMQAKRPETSAELLPEIPNIEELKPYPTAEAVRFVGHTGRVRSCDLSPDGSVLISGSSDGELKYWETMTGRCLKTIKLGDYVEGDNKAVTSCLFCPNTETPFVAATCGKFVFLIRKRVSDIDFPNEETGKDIDPEERHKETPEFNEVTPNIVSLSFARVTEMRQVTFDPTGRYLAILAQSRLVYFFNIRRDWIFTTPIAASNAYIQRIQFHPLKNQFFVATQRNILIFDLREKKKLLCLKPMVQWISSMDVHPTTGEHVIAGSFDGRSFWFDTELKSEPYKVLRGHSGAIRDVAYSRIFPLFAVACDDAKIDIFHGNVGTLIQLPQIIPVKELSGHKQNGILGVLSVHWHPSQPWLVSCGADHTLRLWT